LICELILDLVSLWLLVIHSRKLSKKNVQFIFFIKDILIILLYFFKDILIILLLFLPFLI